MSKKEFYRSLVLNALLAAAGKSIEMLVVRLNEPRPEPVTPAAQAE